MRKRLLLPLACAAACAGETSPAPGGSVASDESGWRIDAKGDLNAFFECIETEGATLVDAHRGGARAGYPENAMETFAATLEAAPAVIETDVAASADGVLFLHHDDTLDRTTTGSGPADAFAWDEIADLRLEDAEGRATAFHPTRLDAALRWADGRTILKLDIKRSAKYEAVIEEVRRHKAEGRIVFIAYSLAQAKKLHRLIPEAMLSLTIGSQSELNAAVAAGIPLDRILAFTGREAPDERLYGLLDGRDVEVIFGTLGAGSLDEAIAASGDDAQYAELGAIGVDLIATDRPAEAHAALARAGRAVEAGTCGVTRD